MICKKKKKLFVQKLSLRGNNGVLYNVLYEIFTFKSFQIALHAMNESKDDYKDNFTEIIICCLV